MKKLMILLTLILFVSSIAIAGDTTPPTVTRYEFIPSTIYTNTKFNISVEAVDNVDMGYLKIVSNGTLGVVKYNCNSNPCSYIWTTSESKAGTYRYRLIAADTSSNKYYWTKYIQILEQPQPEDNEAPKWSNPSVNPASPTYSPNQNYEFKITWTDNYAVDTVLLEFNGINYTTSQSGNEYSKTFSDLPAGSYDYKWYANDTSDNWNKTNELKYYVEQATPSLTLSSSPSWDITYPTETTVSCTVDTIQVTPELFRNNIPVSNPDIQTLDAGTYNYLCGVIQTQNYTSANTSNLLNVNQAQTTIHIALDGEEEDKTYTEPASFNVHAWMDISPDQGTLTLLRNGVEQTELEFDEVDLPEGIYTYELSLESQNYMADPVTRVATVEKIVINIKPDLEVSPSDITITPAIQEGDYNIEITIHNIGNDTATDVYYEIYDNSTLISFNTIGSIIDGSSITRTHLWNNPSSGLHIIQLTVDPNDQIDEWNETNNIAEREITIQEIDKEKPVYSNCVVYPTSPTNYEPGKSYQFNCTWTDNVEIDNVYFIFFDKEGPHYYTYKSGDLSRDGNVFSISLTDLPADTYNYYWSGWDVAGNHMETPIWPYIVKQTDPYHPDPSQAIIHLELNGKEDNLEIEYGTESNATGWKDFSEGELFLYRNSRPVSNPDINILPANIYTYTLHYPETQNYTSATITRILTVNKKNPVNETDPEQSIIHLSLNGVEGDLTVTYPEETTALGWVEQGDIGAITHLFRNNIPVSNPDIQTLDAGTYIYNFSYDESENYTAGWISRTLTVNPALDTEAPVYSNCVVYPTSPTNYEPGKSYQFNCTWTDNVEIDNVWFEFHRPGGIIEEYYYSLNQINKNNNEFYITLTDLPAGIYYYQWYANDTSGNLNKTESIEYIINKSDPVNPDPSQSVVHLALNGIEDDITVIYPTETNATGWVEQGDVGAITKLYRDGFEVNNPDIQTLDVGVYEYNYTYFETQNYTSSSLIRILTVTSLPDTEAPQYSNCYVTPYPAVYSPGQNYEFKCTWTDNYAVDTVLLEFNGINYTTSQSGNEYSKTFSDLPAGSYDYKWYANDTSDNWNKTSLNNYVIDRAPTITRLFLNGTEGNRNYNLNDVANFTVILDVSGKTVKLDTNITGFVTQVGETPLEFITTLTEEGIFNITGYFEGDENYTESSQTYYISVGAEDITPPVITILSPENITYPVNTVWLNYTINEPVDWTGYSLDEQENITITENITLNDLATGTHYLALYANDTSGNMGYADVYFTIACLSHLINSTVDDIYYDDVYTNILTETSTILCSEINDSNVTNSTIIDSTVISKLIIQMVIIDSYVDPANLTGSHITNSNLTLNDDNYILYSNVSDSEIIYSNISESEISGSHVENSNVTNSTIVNSYIKDMIVENAVIINNQLISGCVIYKGVKYCAPMDLDDIYNPKKPTPPTPSGGAAYGFSPWFTITTPQSVTIQQGETKSFTVTVTNTKPWYIPGIAVKIKEIPAGWFTVDPVSQGIDTESSADYTVTITVPENETTGERTITVLATGGGLDASVDMLLIITEKTGITPPPITPLVGPGGGFIDVVTNPAFAVGLVILILVIVLAYLYYFKKEKFNALFGFFKSIKLSKIKNFFVKEKPKGDIEKVKEEIEKKPEKETEIKVDDESDASFTVQYE
ncbi:MAG: CARDB domain-containing protein [Candidatus Aenigmatarchaeota archaeon]